MELELPLNLQASHYFSEARLNEVKVRTTELKMAMSARKDLKFTKGAVIGLKPLSSFCGARSGVESRPAGVILGSTNPALVCVFKFASDVKDN